MVLSNYAAKCCGRSPHGERGLKLKQAQKNMDTDGSLPARGAWIEVSVTTNANHPYFVAPRTGSVD